MAKKILGKVLDISSFQGKLTQEAVVAMKAQKILGVILRIGFTGYGAGQPAYDSCFEHNYKLLHDAGINCGAYYFTLAYNDTIMLREIEWLKKELAKKKFELPIYIDVEKIYPKDPTPISNAWNNCSAAVRSDKVAKICKALQDEKYYVGVYASKAFFGSGLLESYLTPYDKWVAQYWPSCTYKGTYNLWQYTSSANPKTYDIYTGSKLDVSNCYCDFPEVIKKNGLNNYKKQVEQQQDTRKKITCPHCGEVIYLE